MKPVELDPEAADEVREAIAYLESQRPGIGDEFEEAVQDALANIGRRPKAYSPYRTRYRKYVIQSSATRFSTSNSMTVSG